MSVSDEIGQPGPGRIPAPTPPEPPAGHEISMIVEEALRVHLQAHLQALTQQVGSAVAGAGQRLAAHRPAWLRETEGEARWPVALLVLVAIGLQFLIPDRLAVRPSWLLPAVELCLLILLVVANPDRISREVRWLRVVSLLLVATASVANAWSAFSLVRELVQGGTDDDAGRLLMVGGGIWLTNVLVFALWYWEFDRGGPATRSHGTRPYPDFQFPQLQTPDLGGEWEPTFVDYLYLSFTNAMAFSPTDTLPLSRWAKLLMLSQSLVSLATVALVIARAVNILR